MAAFHRGFCILRHPECLFESKSLLVWIDTHILMIHRNKARPSNQERMPSSAHSSSTTVFYRIPRTPSSVLCKTAGPSSPLHTISVPSTLHRHLWSSPSVMSGILRSSTSLPEVKFRAEACTSGASSVRSTMLYVQLIWQNEQLFDVRLDHIVLDGLRWRSSTSKQFRLEGQHGCISYLG